MEGSKQSDPKIVVAGEASESEEDDVNDTATPVSAPAAVKQSEPSNVIVSGEASESDEEYEVNIHHHDNINPTGGIPPLTVKTTEKGDDRAPTPPSTPEMIAPLKSTYNSLLCRKLRERNIALRRHIVDTVHHSYTGAAKDLHGLAAQLQKSKISVQGVSSVMRETTNTLFQLEDRVGILCGCPILPDIHIPQTVVTGPAPAQATPVQS